MPFRHNKDKDTVNRRELRIALDQRVSGRYHRGSDGKDSIAFDGFHNAAALTDSVVDDIILNRPAPGEFKTELGPSEMAPAAITQAELEAMISKGPSEMAPAAITQAELEDALEDLGWGYPKAKAATFFKRVLDRRTSPYNPQVGGQEAITARMTPHNALRNIEREIVKYPSLSGRLKPSLDVLWDYVVKGGNHGSGS